MNTQLGDVDAVNKLMVEDLINFGMSSLLIVIILWLRKHITLIKPSLMLSPISLKPVKNKF